jgi:hypothetical protein
MNGTSDDALRRLFAQAPPVAAEESFVASVAMQVATQRAHRRRWRVVRMALVMMLVAAIAAWLAPYAPLTLPDELAATAQQRAQSLPLYLYLILGAAVLPLAGTAWLVRRR